MFARCKQLFDDHAALDIMAEPCTSEERLLMASYLHLLGDRYAESVIPGASAIGKSEQKATPYDEDPRCSGTYWRDHELIIKAGIKKRKNNSAGNCQNEHRRGYRGPEDAADKKRYYICQSCYKKYSRDKKEGLVK